MLIYTIDEADVNEACLIMSSFNSSTAEDSLMHVDSECWPMWFSPTDELLQRKLLFLRERC